MKRRWIMPVGIALAMSICGAGCSEHSASPRHDDGYYAALAKGQSSVVVVQFALNTKHRG